MLTGCPIFGGQEDEKHFVARMRRRFGMARQMLVRGVVWNCPGELPRAQPTKIAHRRNDRDSPLAVFPPELAQVGGKVQRPDMCEQEHQGIGRQKPEYEAGSRHPIGAHRIRQKFKIPADPEPNGDAR